MGYTHYWHQRRDFSTAEWQTISAATERLIAQLPEHSTSAGGYYASDPLRVVLEYNCAAAPQTGARGKIRFNGHGELGAETFILTRRKAAVPQRAKFCKTYRRPYDLLVCAVLIVAWNVAPSALVVSSDGDPDEWMPALAWVRVALGDAARLWLLPHGVTGPRQAA